MPNQPLSVSNWGWKPRVRSHKLWMPALLRCFVLKQLMNSWCPTLLVTALMARVGDAPPDMMQSILRDSDSRLYGVDACRNRRQCEKNLGIENVHKCGFGFSILITRPTWRQLNIIILLIMFWGFSYNDKPKSLLWNCLEYSFLTELIMLPNEGKKAG